MKPSVAFIANKYLILSNYSIDSKTFELQLITHPNYPSFKSISDTFDYFGVENIVAQVSKKDLSKLPNTFITTLSTERGQEIYLVNKKSNYIILTNDKSEIKKISTEEFYKLWQGLLIVIEQNTNRKPEIKKGEIIGIVMFLILGVIIMINNSSNLIYNLTSMFGLGISYLIIKEDLGINTNTINKVCNTISKEDGCKSVINNTEAKLFSYFSLSDLTVVYFVTQTLFLVFFGYDNLILFSVASISIPLVLLSIFFQAIKIKKWCVLCISISVILLTQFIITISSLTNLKVNYLHLFQIIFLASFTYILLSIFKKNFKEILKLQSVEVAFLKFKRDTSLFILLYKKEKIKEKSSSLGNNRLIFGSKKPKLVIDAITNPLCGFCSPTFLSYLSILEKRNDVQLNVIFSSFTNDFDNDDVKVSQSIINVYHENSEEMALEALKEWYKNKDSEKWHKKYSINSVNSTYIDILNNHQSWITANQIYHTPTTLINNYYFPKKYNIDDLIFFLDDIIENDDKL